MTTSNESKTIEVAMTNRPPVRINANEWPVIAEANWHNGQYDFQANYIRKIRVREHTDGRRLVYGFYEEGPGGATIGFRGACAGFLISRPDNDETVSAIRRVSIIIGDEEMAAECIASMPAETV